MSFFPIRDNRLDKHALVKELADSADLLLPPVYVLSHNRARFMATMEKFPYLRETAYLVVAEEELWEYARYNGDSLNYLGIPEGYRGKKIGIGRARQFVMDAAKFMGHKQILMLDDDLTDLRLMYGIGGGKASTAIRDYVEDRDGFRLGALVLLSVVAQEAFAADETLAVIGPQLSPGFNSEKSSEVRWMTNRGRIPCGMVSWQVDRFHQYVGTIDLDGFNRHGEDLYACMTTIWNGGSIGKIPSLVVSASDGPSVTKPTDELASYRKEYEAIQASPFRAGTYTKMTEDGQPTWSRPDWRKIDKLIDVKRRLVYWEDPPQRPHRSNSPVE